MVAAILLPLFNWGINLIDWKEFLLLIAFNMLHAGKWLRETRGKYVKLNIKLKSMQNPFGIVGFIKD